MICGPGNSRSGVAAVGLGQYLAVVKLRKLLLYTLHILGVGYHYKPLLIHKRQHPLVGHLEQG